MADPFVELSLDQIEEGVFLEEANMELMRMQGALLKHIRKYGEDKTEGTTGELTMKVNLKLVAGGGFAITTKVTAKTPGRPDGTSLAIPGESQTTGEEVLFTRPSGSTSGNPRQRVLATRDGRTVNPKSGRVVDDGDDD